MYIDPQFKQFAPALEIDNIASSSDVIYIVDSNLILRAYNESWITFAMQNDGQGVLQLYPLGTDITKAFIEPFHSYYKQSYLKSLANNEPFSQTYECHSGDRFRTFRQFAYPIHGARGLVITNHLVLEKPHSQTRHRFTTRLVNPDGFIVQCSNCRKTRNPENANQWYWVPELLDLNLVNISHSICPQCLEYYYPEMEDI